LKFKAPHTGIMILILLAFAALFLFSNEFRPVRPPSVEITPQSSFERTLVFVADRDFDPYSYSDEEGTPSGHDMELAYLLARELHVNIEVRLLDWQDCLNAVQTGDADVVLGLEHDSATPFDMSIPLPNSSGFVAFGKKNFQSIGDLYGKRLAVLSGSNSWNMVIEPYGLAQDTASYPTYSEAFQSVMTGENDYCIAQYAVGRRTLARLGNASLRPMGPQLVYSSSCVGVKKGRSDLCNDLNAAIVTLTRSGAMFRLTEKWLGTYVQMIHVKDFFEHYDVEILLAAFMVVAVFLGMMVYFFRRQAIVMLQERASNRHFQEYQQLLHDASRKSYEHVLEFDITHDNIVGESTRQSLEQLGLSSAATYEQVLHGMAGHIHERFVDAYLETFSPHAVTAAWEKGTSSLTCEVMQSGDGEDYHWIRITSRIFSFETDHSIRLITFHQNIDDEKRKEKDLELRARTDEMTTLYNKATTEQFIQETLDNNKDAVYALFIFDIDNFKRVNDEHGHPFGDAMIVTFSEIIKKCFRTSDIVGRIGGDEFAALVSLPNREWVEKKAQSILDAVNETVTIEGRDCKISSSIGIAIALNSEKGERMNFKTLYKYADAALYQTHNNGKNGYQFTPPPPPT
jgi:diguanylate cyclase (GGDEF)-like protein